MGRAEGDLSRLCVLPGCFPRLAGEWDEGVRQRTQNHWRPIRGYQRALEASGEGAVIRKPRRRIAIISGGLSASDGGLQHPGWESANPGMVDSAGQLGSRPQQPQHPAERLSSASRSPPLLVCIQNSNVENLPPHIIRLVYKEVTTLTTDPPDGIKVFSQ